MSNEKSKISNIEWGLMIGVALLFDGVQFFLDVVLIGLIVNRLISIWAWLTFYLWLKIKGVKNFRGWLAIGGIAEIIPVIAALPFWTGMIIVIMIKNKTKEILPKAMAGLEAKAI